MGVRFLPRRRQHECTNSVWALAGNIEAIRESVEDYEYFVLLRQAVARAQAAGRADAAVAAAQALLTTAAAEVLAAEGTKELSWHNPKDRTLAEQARVKPLDALMALQNK
jgi:hypothetical protein